MKGNDLNMYETKVKIDGMMCGMCESHINDAIRNAFSVKKVSASHSKGEADIISEEPIDEAKLREAIKQMVSGGVGVAVLSALAVEQEVQNGTLLAFEIDKSALKRTIYLITLKSQQLSRMEQKLVDFLKSPHRRKRAEAQN